MLRVRVSRTALLDGALHMNIYTKYLDYTIKVYSVINEAAPDTPLYHIRVTEPGGELIRDVEVTTGDISSKLSAAAAYIDDLVADQATFQAALDAM